MPGSQITKKALAEAMKELMAEQAMEKIKVKGIVERCGMNRQSFYYHFKDKYDIVNWIFYTEFVANVESAFDGDNWQLLHQTCRFFYENCVFYKNALSIRGQNSFYDYLNQIMRALMLDGLEEIFKNHDNKVFCATFFADAYCMAIARWLLEGAVTPPDEFADMIRSTIEGVSSYVVNERMEDHI